MLHAFLARERILDRGGGDAGARPQRVEGNAFVGEFSRHAEHAHAHAEFRHGVGGMVAEPARRHIERRRKHQHMRIGRLLQMRNAGLRNEIGAPRIDLVHQVEPLHVGLQGAGQLDRACIVHADIDTAEPRHRLRHRIGHLIVISDIANDRQCLATRLLDLVRRRIDRARQFRMRLRCFRGHGDIGAIARRAQCDRQPDPAARARDEQRLSLQAHRFPYLVLYQFTPPESVSRSSRSRARRQLRCAMLSPVAMP